MICSNVLSSDDGDGRSGQLEKRRSLGVAVGGAAVGDVEHDVVGREAELAFLRSQLHGRRLAGLGRGHGVESDAAQGDGHQLHPGWQIAEEALHLTIL